MEASEILLGIFEREYLTPRRNISKKANKKARGIFQIYPCRLGMGMKTLPGEIRNVKKTKEKIGREDHSIVNQTAPTTFEIHNSKIMYERVQK